MEFAEFIKTPKIDKVTLHESSSKKIECSLCITGHHLILSTRREDESELWLLHQSIDHVEKSQPRSEILSKDWINNASSSQTGGTVTLFCKDLRILRIEISSLQEFQNVAESIEKLSRVAASFMYAFFYRPFFSILENGYTIFRPEEEYAKLLAGGAWRLSKINETYEVCPTYGKAIVVPNAVSDQDIRDSAAFREGGRFPVLCYKHGEVVLMRGAVIVQQNGVKRCAGDETIVNIVLGRTTKGFIIDTREGRTSVSNDTYTQWRKVNHGIKVTADSFAKLMEACNDRGSSVDKYLERLENSHWLSNVLKTLNAACVVAQCLDKEISPVLLQGSDPTLLISGLVQIILNPDCRTIRGFVALIDREFLQGGYPFATRHRYSCYSPARNKTSNPSFLLFLDCVYQLHYQFVSSFEFKINLLEMLFENSYFSQYGTFLGDCEKERENLGVFTKTTSYWTHLFRPEIMDTILNPLYEPNPDVIWPSVAPCSIMLWSELYLRWVVDQSNRRRMDEMIAAKVKKRNELKQKVIKLRKELEDLKGEYKALKLQEPGTSADPQ